MPTNLNPRRPAPAARPEAGTLDALVASFRALVTARIQSELGGLRGPAAVPSVAELPADHPFFAPIPESLDGTERAIVLTALIAHLQPSFFESVMQECLPQGGDFAELGGTKGTSHRGMLPTGETVQFLLAGRDLGARLALRRYFNEEHFFVRRGLLWIEPVREGEPFMSGRLVVPAEWVDRLLHGRESAPRFGIDFPARRIVTEMRWEDVVLNSHTQQQVNDLTVWLEHHHRVAADENLSRKVKPGYRVLFYGPSGTGKTLTAALLGKHHGRDVYRIDLSQVVSKYIGETEKNLENVFRRAESKDWILFFDEADALFGKRTNVQNAHDKYANQEVSYLLQRVEDFSGLLILASNFRNNLDDAFLRRFHGMVHFPMPNAAERNQLWRKAMPAALGTDATVNLGELGRQYEMTGAAILNAVQYAALQVYARAGETLSQEDLLAGIRKEFLKEEKSL
jgi:hypothetical protein